MSLSDFALMMRDPYVRDPFAAMVPFATGSSLLQAGKHRDMPLDVQEVCIIPDGCCSQIVLLRLRMLHYAQAGDRSCWQG